MPQGERVKLVPRGYKVRTKAGLPSPGKLVSKKGGGRGPRRGSGPPVLVRNSQNPSVLSCRCNEGNNQSSSRTPADSAHCERRPVLLKELLPLLEKPGGGSGAATSAANANGRTEVVARSFAPPLEAGPGCGSPLIQELSELEAQIAAIKQQLQAAMRRKRELEQLQSHQQGAPSGLPSARQYALPNPHQQTSTLPQF